MVSPADKVTAIYAAKSTKLVLIKIKRCFIYEERIAKLGFST